eukprot:1344766-Amorphochlora_amoeboformis.AAC.1
MNLVWTECKRLGSQMRMCSKSGVSSKWCERDAGLGLRYHSQALARIEYAIGYTLQLIIRKFEYF